MPRTPLALSALLVCTLCACPSDNPRVCDADDECPAKIAAGHYTDGDDGDGDVLAKDKIYCHPTKHYCYAGCKTSAQCQDQSLRMNLEQPQKTRCNVYTHHCELPGAGNDGGPGDFGTDLEDGQPCGAAAQCKSGFCAGGVCCATACEGSCTSCALPGKAGSCELVPAGEDPDGDCAGTDSDCAGQCDGAGACTFPGAEAACGTASCAAAQITRRSCDGSGGCAAGEPATCGGYACDAAGTACKASCTDAATDCEATFECVSGECSKPQENGAPCATNPKACKSGFCVDGSCCGVADCPDCQTCATADGSCQPRAAGPAPAGECPGEPVCGGGQCDAAGQCAYAAPGTVCAESCAGETHNVSQCSPEHTCAALAPASCAPYLCDAGGVVCRSGCATHGDCVAASLCDRAQAHVAGAGACVQPASIATVTSTIQAAVDGLAGQTHVRVPAKGYSEQLTIAGKTVTLVGMGAVTVAAPQFVDGPAISVSGGANVTLQGLTVQGATGADGDGVYCIGPGATLSVVESTIKGNEEQGIDSYKCNATVRRSTVQTNQGGGLKLGDGTFVLVNNVITSNGNISSTIGGVTMSPSQTTGSVFSNNTVAGNNAAVAGRGVNCTVPVDIVNSIVYLNGSSPVLNCTSQYSDIEGSGGSGTGNLDVDPAFVSLVGSNFSLQNASPCIDKGADNPHTVIDLAGTPRKQGAAVDLGAYEVQ